MESSSDGMVSNGFWFLVFGFWLLALSLWPFRLFRNGPRISAVFFSASPRLRGELLVFALVPSGAGYRVSCVGEKLKGARLPGPCPFNMTDELASVNL